MMSASQTTDALAGKGSGLILAIESSCDETAAAVVERGEKTISSVVASQIPTHAPYGGVVPELASREHLRNIVPVVREAVSQAGCSLQDLDAIAVTSGPGLAGALLVGIMYAKTMASALSKPLIAVNHLEGHIHAVLLEQRQAREQAHGEVLPLPSLALVVSGGHTHLYIARQHGTSWTYSNIGRTVDDAAGEAFDKVSKLLGLGYPGGPWIDALSRHGDPQAVPFSFAQIKQKAHLRGKPGPEQNRRFLFSFSGIKTAVLRYVEVHGLKDSIDERRRAMAQIAKPTAADALALCDAETLGLIASFQHAVVGDLIKKTFEAAESVGAQSILVSGGVSANRELRVRFTAQAADQGIPIAFPSLSLSTDNAAMIGAAAWPKFLASEFATSELSASPSLALGQPR